MSLLQVTEHVLLQVTKHHLQQVTEHVLLQVNEHVLLQVTKSIVDESWAIDSQLFCKLYCKLKADTFIPINKTFGKVLVETG